MVGTGNLLLSDDSSVVICSSILKNQIHPSIHLYERSKDDVFSVQFAGKCRFSSLSVRSVKMIYNF